jgi:hypothetical protein
MRCLHLEKWGNIDVMNRLLQVDGENATGGEDFRVKCSSGKISEQKRLFFLGLWRVHNNFPE